MPRTTILAGMIAGELKSPPETWPTLTTAVSVAFTLRLTMVWIAMMNCAVTIVVSAARWAAAPPWPPVPRKVAVQVSLAAMNGPLRVAKVPTGRPGALCMP